jgi:hypothetical protein
MRTVVDGVEVGKVVVEVAYGALSFSEIAR